MPGHEQLGDLNGVQGRALSKLVSYHPKVQGMVVRKIFTEAAHKAIVLAGGKDRHRVKPLVRIVDHLKARHLRKQLARFFYTDLAFRLNVHRHRVGGEDGDTNGCGRDPDRSVTQDLSGLEDEF